MNPHHMRARFGAFAMAALSLLAASVVNAADPDVDAALIAYARRGDAQAVAELLRQGADPNALDDQGKTPLHKAIAGDGDLAVVQALVVARARLDVADSEGVTPVRLAGIHGKRQLYDWLVEQSGGKEPAPANATEIAAPTNSLEESFKNLASRDQAVRRAAQRRLVFDHEQAVPEILRRVDAGEPIERFGDVLTAMGPQAAAAIPRLASQLADKQHAFGALLLINRMQPDAFEKLPAEQQAAAAESLYQVAIDPGSDVMGGMAIQFLATMGPSATPVILKLLGDANPRLRAAMARRLRQPGPHDEQVTAALLKLAQHDLDTKVRVNSIVALSHDRRYRDEFRESSLKTLKSPPPHDLSTTNPDEQRAIDEWRSDIGFAADVLQHLGAESIDDLVPLLSPINRPGRIAAIGAIVAMGAPAVPRLIELLGHSDEAVSVSASVALNKIGLPAVPSLVEALQSENEQVVQRAANALWWIGPRAHSALPQLLKMVESEQRSDAARLAIAHAALRIDPQAARRSTELLATLPALIRMLDQGGFKHQGMAAECLKEFGPPAAEALPRLRRRLELPGKDVDTQGLVNDYVQRAARQAITAIEAKPDDP